MIEIDTDFPFLGSREYIHGTSILCGFVEALEQAGNSGIVLKRLKFQQPATSNGRLFLTTGEIDAGEMEAANCTLLATAGAIVWRGLFAERGAAVARRLAVSYPVSGVEANGFGGSCTISPRDRADLVRALVEANKRFHEAALAPAATAVRFGYIEGWAVPPRDIRFSARLAADNLIARKSPHGYMTINRMTYTARTQAPASTLTLCFNVDTLQEEPA